MMMATATSKIRREVDKVRESQKQVEKEKRKLLENKLESKSRSSTAKKENILKAIKNATGTSVIFPINISLIHFVLVLTSVPNVGERFTKI